MRLEDKCLVINFSDFGDDRGKLVVIESGNSIPFDIKRIFYIYGTDKSAIRGNHANRYSEFVLINVAGKSKVRINDGREELIIELDQPLKGLYIPKMIWKEMYDFTDDSVLLVLSNMHYDMNEYISDFNEYVNIMKMKNN